jgi:hypothetical protein
MAGGERIAVAYGADARPGRVVLAKREKGRAALLAAGSPEDPAVRSALAAAAADVRAGRAALAAAMPAEASVLRVLRTPLKSAEKARRVWGSLLDLELPMPVEDAVWTVGREWRSAEGGREAVAHAATRGDWEAFEGRLAEDGVEATHIDAFPEALFAAMPAATRPEGHRVAVWLGDGFAASAGGTSAGVRSFHAMRAGAGSGEGFVRRFEARAAEFLELEDGPDVWWGGPGAADEELLRRLEGIVKTGGWTARFGVIPGGEGALAMALAGRAAEGRTTGFPRGERESAAWEKRGRRRAAARRWLAAGLGVTACVLCAVAKGRREAALEGLRSEIAATAERLAGKRLLPGQELLLLGREPLKGQLAARADAFRRAADPRGLEADVAELLEAARETGVPLTGLSLAEGAFSAEAGPGGGEGAWTALEERWRGLGWEVSREGSATPKWKGVRK